MWIAGQMNLEAENEINLKSAFLPLRCRNITEMLRLDWNEILPHQSDDEIYLIEIHLTLVQNCKTKNKKRFEIYYW